MPDLGGLRDKKDVKILILFLLSNINRPLTMINISDVLLRYGQADYFDIAEGLEELAATYYIEKITYNGTTDYHPTGQGLEAGKELFYLIPSSVREKTMRSALETLSILNRESQIISSHIKNDEGYVVTCQIKDESLDIFEFSLFVPNEFQVHIVEKKFKENPELFYKTMIELITKSEEE